MLFCPWLECRPVWVYNLACGVKVPLQWLLKIQQIQHSIYHFCLSNKNHQWSMKSQHFLKEFSISHYRGSEGNLSVLSSHGGFHQERRREDCRVEVITIWKSVIRVSDTGNEMAYWNIWTVMRVKNFPRICHKIKWTLWLFPSWPLTKMVVTGIALRHGGMWGRLILRLWNPVAGSNISWVRTLGALPSLSYTKRKKGRIYLGCPGKAGALLDSLRSERSCHLNLPRWVRVRFGSF